MTVSNHFDPVQDAGFTCEMNVCDARRQLHVSAAAIVVIMVIAALAVIAMPGLLHGAYAPAPIKLTVHAPQAAHFLQAALRIRSVN